MRILIRSCLLFLPLITLFDVACCGQAVLTVPEVDAAHQRFFAHFTDSRSVPIPVLNQLSLDPTRVGRSFALLAGISTYPSLPSEYKDLKPASEDIRKLEDYLEKVEYFDEIVILKDEDVTSDNLEYFLQGYFLDRLQKYPNSRFLLAYSGHGFTYGSSSFALSTRSTNIKDLYHSLNLFNLRTFVEFDRPYAHYTLALLNTCNSGAFLNRPFGGSGFELYASGAHAITAGTIDQLVWSYPDVGSGSLLFEKLYAALDGRANKMEPLTGQNSALVTVDQLYRYLSTQIADKTSNHQTPKWGDLDPDGSRGSFYFFDRARLVDNNLIPPWNSSTPESAPMAVTSVAMASSNTLSHVSADMLVATKHLSQSISLDPTDTTAMLWPPNAVEGGTYVVKPDEQTKEIPYLKLPRGFTILFDPAIEEIHWTVAKMEFGIGATIDLSPPHMAVSPGTSGADVVGRPAPGAPGQPGGRGGNGKQGRDGRNLTLNITEFEPHGSLWIKTDGGAGGPGGRGGNGQLGGPPNCGIMGIQRTGGGQGGVGGPGGDGGRGGSPSFVRVSITKIPEHDSSNWLTYPQAAGSDLKCGPSERPPGLMDDEGRIVVFGRPGCGGPAGVGGAPGPGGDEGTSSKCHLLGLLPVLGSVSGGVPGSPGAKGNTGDLGLSSKPMI
jgi:hypothetical protein